MVASPFPPGLPRRSLWTTSWCAPKLATFWPLFLANSTRARRPPRRRPPGPAGQGPGHRGGAGARSSRSASGRPGGTSRASRWPGIPVYSQPGRGGGWELVGGARTDLSGLDRRRGPCPLPHRRPLRRHARGPGRPAQARASPAGHLPRARRGGRERRRARSLRMGPRGAGGAGPSRNAPACRDRRCAGRARLPGSGRARVVTHRRSAGARGQEQRLVPRGGHRRPGSGPSGSAGCGRCSSRRRPPSVPTTSTWRRRGAPSSPTVDAQRAPVRVRLRTDPAIVDVLRWMFGNRVERRRRRDPTGGSRWSSAASPSSWWRASWPASPTASRSSRRESVRRHLADIGRGLVRTNA